MAPCKLTDANFQMKATLDTNAPIMDAATIDVNAMETHFLNLLEISAPEHRQSQTNTRWLVFNGCILRGSMCTRKCNLLWRCLWFKYPPSRIDFNWDIALCASFYIHMDPGKENFTLQLKWLMNGETFLQLYSTFYQSLAVRSLV